MKSFLLVILGVFFLSSAHGGRESGGGDEFTLDFVHVAQEVIYPWLLDNGSSLHPEVDAEDFLAAIDPKIVSSQEHVFETCRDSRQEGREVDVCYNANSDEFHISRTRYLLQDNSNAKIRLVAHEIFRKMGLEGDDYKISRQMSLLDANSPLIPGPRADCPEQISFRIAFCDQGVSSNIQVEALANAGTAEGTCFYRLRSGKSSLGTVTAPALFSYRQGQLFADMSVGSSKVRVMLRQEFGKTTGGLSVVQSWSSVDVNTPLRGVELDPQLGQELHVSLETKSVRVLP